MRDSNSFGVVMGYADEREEIKHYKINKSLPETLTIENIILDMKKSRFLIRPAY